MRALDRKLLRDLRRIWAQSLAIALVLACGIMVLVLANAARQSLGETRDAYYERHRFGDVFASATRAPRSLLPAIAAIEGVARAEPRVVLPAVLDIDGLAEPATALVLSLPAERAAMLNLPLYINRYLFPKLSFLYGKNQDKQAIYQYTIKSARYLLLLMIIVAIGLAALTPLLFKLFFPKYIDSVLATQIILFSGVFYSVNALFHNSLNSLKHFKPFKFIITLRIVFIIGFAVLFHSLTHDLLIAVALSAATSELLNMFNYIYFLRKLR